MYSTVTAKDRTRLLVEASALLDRLWTARRTVQDDPPRTRRISRVLDRAEARTMRRMDTPVCRMRVLRWPQEQTA
jgi:hypothetical protein